MDPVAQYAHDILSGKILAGTPVRLACERHLRDLEQGEARGLVWQQEKAERAIRFFTKILHLEDGRPFILEPFEAFIVGSLFGWVREDGHRRFRTAYIEVAKGNGKALALDTAIPTPSGWSLMGDLQAGDWVFDERGQPTQVLFATDPMSDHKCYRVKFSDGEEIIADAEHLWLTKPLRNGGFRGPKAADLPRKRQPYLSTTEQIATTVLMKVSASLHPQAKYNHRVDVAGALQLPELDLPIPPFTLGCWLGDGDSATAMLTCADLSILEEIAGEGVTIGEKKAQRDNKSFRVLLGKKQESMTCPRGHEKTIEWHDEHCRACARARNKAHRQGTPLPKVTASSLQKTLREIGVLNNKHIPPTYFRASYSQRLSLLQGLLDTDGSIMKDGQIEFCVCRERLALDFITLARTLGLRPTMTSSDAKLNGRTVGIRYRVRITAYDDMPVFRLTRKRIRQKPRPRTLPISSGRMIVGCEPIESVPVKCIKVGNPSGLFLAGKGLIPTHNSPMAGGLGIYGLVADGEHSAEIYSAATGREQASICFKDAKRMVEASPDLANLVEVNVGNLAVLSTNSYFRPVSSEHKGLDGKRVHIALIDELHEHPNAMVVDKMRAGTKNRQDAILFEITNSGHDRNSVCWQHHELSLKILQGVLENDAWFAYVATLDPCAICAAEGKTQPNPECDQCDDWRDEKVWIKANPGLGTILPRQYLREQVAEAVNMPSKENIVRRLNFCQWCVAFGTLISMSDGTRRPAEELHEGDAILAFDEETQTIVSATVHHVAEQAIVPIYRIETARGRIVNVTGNHRFWARWGRPDAPKYGWKRADEMQVGVRIASALGNKLPRDVLGMKAEEAYLLGVIIGDGTCKELKITTSFPEIMDACNAVMRTHDCEFVKYKNGGPWHYAKHLSPKGTTPIWLRQFLTQHGLKNKIGRNKRVPLAVFTGGMKVWAAFLSGYLDTDGCILETKGNRIAQWSSTCRDLLSDCQHLLALMGVQSSVNTIERDIGDCHRLEVRDPISLSMLAEHLSLLHPEKARRLAQFSTQTRACYRDRRHFDLVKNIQILPPQPTIGIEVEHFHTHVTDGLISHNTESQTRWLSMTRWDECNLGPVTLESLKGRSCFIGLDLAATIDIAALVLLFPPLNEEEDWYTVLPYFFVPEEHPRAHSESDQITYKEWIRQGYMIATEGDVIDYDAIRACISGPSVLQSFAPGSVETYTKSLQKWKIPPEGLKSYFNIQEIAKDRWNSTGIGTQLQGDGLTVVDFGQGFASMTAPARSLEGLVQGKRLNHGGNPVLRWMASNTMAKQDPAGNIKPDKEKSKEKIDGIVGLLMALGRAMAVPVVVNSIYETRGVVSVARPYAGR